MLRILIKFILYSNRVGTCPPWSACIVITLRSDDSGAEGLQQRLQGQPGWKGLLYRLPTQSFWGRVTSEQVQDHYAEVRCYTHYLGCP